MSLRLAKIYLKYAEDLDAAGISDEAYLVSRDVARYLDLHERAVRRGLKLAIRGNSSWEDYLQTVTVGAGAGAAGGAAIGGVVGGLAGLGVATPATLPAGAGAGAAAGAAYGALGGLAEKAGSDLLYNVSGTLTKARALANDFGYFTDQLGRMYPQIAKDLAEVAKTLQTEVGQVYDAKRDEIAAQYGLDPRTSFWENVKHPSNWGGMIGSKFRMFRSQAEGRMERFSQNTQNPNTPSGISDDAIRGLWQRARGWFGGVPSAAPVAGGAALEGGAAAAGGLSMGGVAAAAAPMAAGMVGGTAGGIATNYLYNQAEDAIRGRAGKERYILSQMDQITREIGRLLNNPNAQSFMTYITGLLSSAGGGQQEATPTQQPRSPMMSIQAPANPQQGDYSVAVS
jgi:hypothetical protein